MAKQGKCVNIDCDHYKETFSIQAGEDFECPHCHQPLGEVEGKTSTTKKGGGGGPNWLLIGGIAAVVLVIVGAALFFLLSNGTPKAKKLTLDKESITFRTDQTDRLKVTIEPKNATPELAWVSSDDKIVSVKDGSLLASKAGKAKITVYVKDDESVKAVCECIVVEGDVDMETLSINEDPILLKTGGKQRLSVTFTPEDQTEMIFWESSDESIAKVSDRGLVEAFKPGEVTITATSERTGVTATAKVTVEGHNSHVKVIGTEPAAKQSANKQTNDKQPIGKPNQQPKSGSINLGYGTYRGEKTSDGKRPEGHGVITFTSSHRIVSWMDYVASPGDTFEGEFRNGAIQYGYWKRKSDGNTIFIQR